MAAPKVSCAVAVFAIGRTKRLHPSALSPIKSLEGRPGHPAADPRILLALWLFATIEGVASARQVARLCGEHIAYRWLCGGVGMNAKTLADFRVGHGAGRSGKR